MKNISESLRPFWYCASVCCARRHLPPVYRLRPASRPLQPFRPFLPAKDGADGLGPNARRQKYHSKSTCSNMKDPEKVTLSKAKAEGFTACKKCY